MIEQSVWTLLTWSDTGWIKPLCQGFLLTLWLSFWGYGVAIIFGLFGMWAKVSSSKVAQFMAHFYTHIVRGLPELLIVLLLYYAVSQGIEQGLIALNWVDDTFSISPFWAAIAALGFVSGAYMTEVLRSAYLTVSQGQIEAALAFGMSSMIIFRRIIFPPLFRYALPGMGNLWLVITKESAIISVLGSYHELLYTGYMAAASTHHYLLFYTLTAALFLVITLISLWILSRLEHYFGRWSK